MKIENNRTLTGQQNEQKKHNDKSRNAITICLDFSRHLSIYFVYTLHYTIAQRYFDNGQKEKDNIIQYFACVRAQFHGVELAGAVDRSA